MTRSPAYDVDFYGDAFLADPDTHYRAMRDLGPVVWLPQYDAYAITRYADVREALRNDKIFISGKGVLMAQPANEAAAAGGSVLMMDGEPHKHMRKILAEPVSREAMAVLKPRVDAMAVELLDRLVARGQFDGVADFAQFLPLMLVSRLVGLPEEGREKMLDWAYGVFNMMGGFNDRFLAGMPLREESFAYLLNVKRENLAAGSWAARLFDFVDAGEVPEEAVRMHLDAYITPALDTTINATGSALWLLGQNPGQWDAVRADRSLIPAAIDEAMRLESPIRAFSRYVARDCTVDGTPLPEGSRVLVVYASANRDERFWENPDRFDVRRRAPQAHLAFGVGAHMCMGMHLAHLEMRCLFEALADRVKRFEVSQPSRQLHNVLRGLKHFHVTITQIA